MTESKGAYRNVDVLCFFCRYVWQRGGKCDPGLQADHTRHAMEITDKLEGLIEKAKGDAALRDRLLATRNSSNPVSEFCDIATECGFPMSVMDMINQGEEFYAEIKRSTNGGGENSPDLDFQNDEYSIFMMRLSDL